MGLELVVGFLTATGPKHTVFVKTTLCGRWFPKIEAHDGRRVDEVEPRLKQLVAQPASTVCESSALGVQENGPEPARLLKAEEVEFRAELRDRGACVLDAMKCASSSFCVKKANA